MTSEEKETLWYSRAIEMLKLKEHKNGIASWWLRLEYPEETWSTSQINYWLKKSVDKGLLSSSATCYSTQYSFPAALKEAQTIINPKN